MQTPEQQRELETAQEKVDGYSRAIDARKDILPPPSEQNSALQLRANDARKAAEEATQPTPEYSRKKQRVANALRKLLFKMRLTDVEFVTTNVIPPENSTLKSTADVVEHLSKQRTARESSLLLWTCTTPT